MLRYSSVLRSNALQHREISYNKLTPKPDINNPHAMKPQKLKRGFRRVMELLMPYSGVRIFEQMRAVVPLAFYLVLFQLIILRQPIDAAFLLVGGLTAVIIGLALFMEGLNRSEERRVGTECRSRWTPDNYKQNYTIDSG